MSRKRQGEKCDKNNAKEPNTSQAPLPPPPCPRPFAKQYALPKGRPWITCALLRPPCCVRSSLFVPFSPSLFSFILRSHISTLLSLHFLLYIHFSFSLYILLSVSSLHFFSFSLSTPSLENLPLVTPLFSNDRATQ